MHETLLTGAALACVYAGFGWLALAMPDHWAQVAGARAAQPGTPALLRGLGALALAASLALWLLADPVAMAALAWTMALAAGAAGVALTLAWRPRWLRLLLPPGLAA